MPDKWETEWPTKAGCYWLFGWQYKYDKEQGKKPKFIFVEVRKIENGFIHVANGQFMYKSHEAEGKWQEVKFPPEPQIN